MPMTTAVSVEARPVSLQHRILPYAGCVFSGALLLFLVQPMAAKQVLPRFGGAAAVWTACLMFFQVVLLLGYLYADWSTRKLGLRMQGWMHVILILVGGVAAWLPSAGPSGIANSSNPTWGVVSLLATTVGLPYFVLASTSPLLQAWYASVERQEVPYRLYALSNFGSLLALLGYPLLVEPQLDLPAQLLFWRLTYVLFGLVGLAVAVRTARSQELKPRSQAVPVKVEWSTRLTWIALAACPSALLLAVTNELCQDIAPVPLLWIAPLAVYLVTFIICFDHGPILSRRTLQVLMPVVMFGLLWIQPHAGQGLLTALTICLGGLFVIAMFCHGRLADLKPQDATVTVFYVCISVGGAVGGLFVGLVAPLLFSDFAELRVAVATALALSLGVLYGYRSKAFAVTTAACTLLIAQVAAAMTNADGALLFQGRNFYGTLGVRQSSRVRSFLHGMIIHGTQFTVSEGGLNPKEPTAYFGRRSGIGLALQRTTRPQRVGVVGLGVGTLAAYSRPGDSYRFYEINPMVDEVARRDFTFLKDAAAQSPTILGDGRLSLSQEADQHYDTLVLDAFSGDSVPVHLLTREAFQTYFRHLQPDGIVAVNITNRYLDLTPVVATLADAFGRRALRVSSPGDAARAINPAVWMLVGGDALNSIHSSAPSEFMPPGTGRLWTDRYSNILGVMRVWKWDR
jgi:hypothetical protein